MKNIIKKILIIAALLAVINFGFFGFTEARTVSVKGYYKPSTGSYVQPYYRTSPNRSKWDNYSTKGNYNPYTGKRGTVSPYYGY